MTSPDDHEKGAERRRNPGLLTLGLGSCMRLSDLSESSYYILSCHYVCVCSASAAVSRTPELRGRELALAPVRLG